MAELDLDVSADISLATNGTKQAEKQAVVNKYSRFTTFSQDYHAAAAALTYGFLDFPPAGVNEAWEVLRVSISGNDPFTSLGAAQAIVFCGSNTPQDSSTEPNIFNDLIGPPTGIPNVLEVPRRSVVLLSGAMVIICMKGLANNQQIQASMAVMIHDRETFFKQVSQE